jgi:hypothetical protein
MKINKYIILVQVQILKFIEIGKQLQIPYLYQSGIMMKHQFGLWIIHLFLLTWNIFWEKYQNYLIKKSQM